MRKLAAVIKGELKRYFASPLAVVYLICFLMLNGSFALYFGGIFKAGAASLRPMFDFMPWIYLLFVSGIAMRLWAEEFKSKTVLQIMTMPVSATTYVWGKFSAAWIFCTLGVILTLPFVITVNWLGNPDNGVIFNSYIGAIILAGAMLAIAQTASAMTKNQVIALVISVILNLLFFLCGLEYVLGFLRGFTSDYFVDTVATFSFLTHAANFNSGLFKFNDLVFFGSLIVIFNCFTTMLVARKTAGVTAWLKLHSLGECVIAALLIGFAFIGVNLTVNSLTSGVQIDWTEDKLFTPTITTKKILQNLPSKVTAKLYYSKLLGERDENMRMNFDNIKQLLRSYRQIAKGRFNYRIYDTEALSEEEDQAISAGLQGLPVSDLNAAAYFGMVLSDENGHVRTIPFFPMQRRNLIEQDIIENIYLLNHKPLKLGILTSLPMMGESFGEGVIKARWQIVDELDKYYDLKQVNAPEDLQELDLLMIVHPQGFSENMEQAIYNFSISGGKILAFFDLRPESLEMIQTKAVAFAASNYGSLPERWGFHFYSDMVVADLENSTQITIETPDYSGTTQDLIQFYVTDKNMFADLPEVGQLKRILMTSASVFMPLKESKIYFVPLMQASRDSAMVPAYVVNNKIHPAEILRKFKADEQPKYVAAHIYSQEEGKNFEIIAVGDVDMLYDSFWTTNVMIGKQSYNVPLLDNANFVLNALEVLSGNDVMLSLRGKSPRLRPFDNLERQQKQILREYKVKEKDVFDQIALIKRGLAEVFAKRNFEARTNFTVEELALIAKIRRNLADKKQELYDIRQELNRHMEQTELLVKLFNIYMIPLIIVLLVLWHNRNSWRCQRWEKVKFGKRLMILLGVTMGILLFGIGCYYYQKRQVADDVRNTPMFEKIEQKINETAQIKIKNKTDELHFVSKNGTWILQGQENFLVNQARIANFLDAMIDAKIYEKAAEKIENLATFGLKPLDDADSKMTEIELSDVAGREILRFEVGDYNVDLGRGSMGAYIKFPNKFQVWLSKIDLVSLETDYHGWTFANLWNLHLGRFVDVNNSGDVDFIAQTAGVLLNVPLYDKKEQIDNAESVLTIKLQGEYFDSLTLDFVKSGEKYYVHYDFAGIKNHKLLEKFAAQMQGYYSLDNRDMERIKRVTEAKKPQ